jgi:hypothetical protein
MTKDLTGKCFEEALTLVGEGFSPQLDNIGEDTIDNILFSVLIEYDLAVDGEIKVSPRKLKEAERFLIKWREYAQDKELYSDFIVN